MSGLLLKYAMFPTGSYFIFLTFMSMSAFVVMYVCTTCVSGAHGGQMKAMKFLGLRVGRYHESTGNRNPDPLQVLLTTWAIPPVLGLMFHVFVQQMDGTNMEQQSLWEVGLGRPLVLVPCISNSYHHRWCQCTCLPHYDRLTFPKTESQIFWRLSVWYFGHCAVKLVQQASQKTFQENVMNR